MYQQNLLKLLRAYPFIRTRRRRSAGIQTSTPDKKTTWLYHAAGLGLHAAVFIWCYYDLVTPG